MKNKHRDSNDIVPFLIAFVSVFIALEAPAFAQTAPQPLVSPSPSAPATVALKQDARISTQTLQVGHLPVIDIVPIWTAPGADLSARQYRNFDSFDVGGTIKLPITRSLSFSFDRNVGGTLDQAPERYLVSGVPSYPSVSRSVILVGRINYEVNSFNFVAGLSFRHRAGGNSEVSRARYPQTVSSSEWHYGFLGAAYTTPHIRGLLNSQFTFSVTGEYQPVDHNVALLKDGRVKIVDENARQNQYYESTESVGVIVPLRAGLSFAAQDSWGAADFYENAPFPYRWDSYVALAITKKFNDCFSLTVRDEDQHFAPQGAPAPYPNAQHTEALEVLADFHLDLNKVSRCKPVMNAMK